MRRQGQDSSEQTRWLTNSYSDFVPTKVGDTVKEKTFAYVTAADRYDKAKLNFQTKKEGLNAVQVAPGNKEFYDKGLGEYDNAYKNAEEQGDFENMEYDAGDIATDIASKYRVKELQSDYAKYTAQETALQEIDQPESWKAYTRAKHSADNKEGTVDSEGNLIYNKYVDMKALNYRPVADELKTYLKDMETQGYYQREIINGKETGKFIVLKDFPGQSGILKKTVLTSQSLYNVGMDYLNSSQPHYTAIRDEATVRVGGIFLAKENVTLEELLPVLNEGNPEKVGTEAYKKFLKDRVNYVNKKLEERREEAGTKKFDEQGELENLVTTLVSKDIQSNYAEGAAKLLNKYDEDITMWADKKNEGEEGAESPADALNNSGMFDGHSIYTDDTFVNTQLTRLTELGESITQLEAKQVEQSQALAEDPDSIPLGELKGTASQLDKAVKEKEYINRQLYVSAEAVQDFLQDEDLIPEKESYEEYVDREYNLYQEENNDDKEMSKEDFTIALNEALLKAMNNEDQPLIKTGINKAIHQNRQKINEAIFHRLYKGFDIEYDVNTNKEIGSIKEWLNSEQIIKDIAFNYPTELLSMGNTNVVEFIKNSGKEAKDMNFTLSSVPSYGGDLVGQLSYVKVTGKSGEQQSSELRTQTFAFPKSNEKTKTVKAKIKQSMQNLTNSFLPHYNDLNDDKKEMVQRALTLTNIADGTYDRFNSLNIRGTKEGEVTPNFELGKQSYSFTTYKTSDKENHYVIEKFGVVNNGKTASSELEPVVLGWMNTDIDENGMGIGKAYWVKKKDVMSTNNSGNKVSFKGFTPADVGGADSVLQAITEDNAFSTGTLNKDATSLEQLHENPLLYREEVLQDNTKALNEVDKAIESYKDTYTKDKGYFPLTAITGHSNLISKNVQTPYIRVSETGLNKLSTLFQGISINTGIEGQDPWKVIITSGVRTKENNTGVKGDKNSKHLEGLALDILFDVAGKALIEEIKSNPEKYKGVIDSFFPSEAGFYHLTLSQDLQNN